MAEKDNERDEFIEQFKIQLLHVDEFVQTILNAHWEVEGHLDQFLERIFLHPEVIEEGRLQFFAKVHIARAYTPDHSRPEWPLMLALNTLRNQIAHRSRNRPLLVDTKKLKSLLVNCYSAHGKMPVQNLSTKDIVVYSAAICCGFLLVLDEQLARAKGEWVEGEDE